MSAPTPRPAALINHIVDWHNSHPLAQRITPAQVGEIEWVDLPFMAPEAAAVGPAGLPPETPSDVPSALTSSDESTSSAEWPGAMDEASEPTAEHSPDSALVVPQLDSAPTLEAVPAPSAAEAQAAFDAELDALLPAVPAASEVTEPTFEAPDAVLEVAAGAEDDTPRDEAPVEPSALEADAVAAAESADVVDAAEPADEASPDAVLADVVDPIAEPDPSAPTAESAAPAAADSASFDFSDDELAALTATAPPLPESLSASDPAADGQVSPPADVPPEPELASALEEEELPPALPPEPEPPAPPPTVRPKAPPLPTPKPWWHPAQWWQWLRGGGPAVAADGAVPVFKTGVLPQLKPTAVAAWVAAHAQAQRPKDLGGLPKRPVTADARLSADADYDAFGPQSRFVRGAAIDVPGRRLNVLIGADPAGGQSPVILGRRAFDRVRVSLAALSLMASMAGGALTAQWLSRGAAPAAALSAVAASAPKPAASAASDAKSSQDSGHEEVLAASGVWSSASTPDHVASDAHDGGHAAAAASSAAPTASAAHDSKPSKKTAAATHGDAHGDAPGAAHANAAPASAARPPASPASGHGAIDPHAPTAAASATVAPVDVPVTRGVIDLGMSDASRQQAKDLSEAARAARAASQAEAAEKRAASEASTHRPDATRPPAKRSAYDPPPLRALKQAPTVVTTPAPERGPAVKPGAKVYALMSPGGNSRSDADLLLRRIKAAAALVTYDEQTRFEIIEADRKYRAAWYPFVDRAAAERIRATLMARGVATELVEF